MSGQLRDTKSTTVETVGVQGLSRVSGFWQQMYYETHIACCRQREPSKLMLDSEMALLKGRRPGTARAGGVCVWKRGEGRLGVGGGGGSAQNGNLAFVVEGGIPMPSWSNIAARTPQAQAV